MNLRGYKMLALALISIAFIVGCSDVIPASPVTESVSPPDLSTDNNQVFGQVTDTTVKETAVVNIEGAGSFSFNPNEVKTTRPDIFKPGVITAIDTILSLGEAGLLSYDLQWYESIGTAGLVKSYWVERINEDQSAGRCGFVYEAGNELFRFFKGNHNHIPSDIRVLNSPAYLEYFWICI
ncbi:MAG: hypothetical protein K0B84_03485 [Firmicutes bacterium]|nr:hypothetical protein [Bacillota bacterium]